MFNVFCIIKPDNSVGEPCAEWPPIEVGDIKEVSDTDEWEGRLWYAFVGMDQDFAYAAECFAQIPNATDEEIEEEYQEQEAANLDRELAKIVHEYENA